MATSKGKSMFDTGAARKKHAHVLKEFPAFQDSAFEDLAIKFRNLASQANEKGELELSQFKIFCMYALSMEMDQAETFFKVFDKDGSGSISASEFVATAAAMSSAPLKDKLDMCFTSIDLDGNGKVNSDELYAGLMLAKGLTTDDYDEATSAQLKKLMDGLDIDNNGLIEKEEFVKGVLADVRLVDCLGTWMRTIPNLKEEHTVRLKTLFKDIDSDGSGKLSLHEMTAFGAANLGGDKKKAKKKAMRLMKKMDLKGYDGIDEEEFLVYCTNLFEGKSNDEVAKAIDFMVKNRPKK